MLVNLFQLHFDSSKYNKILKSLSDISLLIKVRTSRILRQEFPYLTTKLPTLWTNSYFVSTVGGAPLSVIKEYVEIRKSHKGSGEMIYTKDYKFRLYSNKKKQNKLTKKLIKEQRRLSRKEIYSTSLTYSRYGYRNPLTMNVREWTCPKCGAHRDRDKNVAKNHFSKVSVH